MTKLKAAWTWVKTWVKAQYAKLPNAWKAGIHTAWLSASGTFVLNLLGFLAKVQEWAGSTGTDFPSVTPLGKATVSLVVGVVLGLCNVIFRKVKPGPVYPQNPPDGK